MDHILLDSNYPPVNDFFSFSKMKLISFWILKVIGWFFQWEFEKGYSFAFPEKTMVYVFFLESKNQLANKHYYCFQFTLVFYFYCHESADAFSSVFPELVDRKFGPVCLLCTFSRTVTWRSAHTSQPSCFFFNFIMPIFLSLP